MSKSTVQKNNNFSYTEVLKSLFPWKGDPIREVIRKIIFLLAVIVFGVCAYLIFDYFYENYKNNKMYSVIQEDIPVLSDIIENNIENSVEATEMLSYMKDLVDQNPDIVGFIQIPDKNGDCTDSKVNYPILQRKDEPDFYLDHNIYGEKVTAGSIYLDWRNSLEAFYQSDNMLIYGHDMKDGSMFGSLSKYDKLDSFYEEHPCIEISSRYDVSTYKIFGVFYADGANIDSAFQYYNTTGFNSESDFYDYVNQIKKRSLILNEVDIKYGDKLVLLQTCATGYYNEARFVVAARKLREGEERYSGTENNSRNPNPLMPIKWYEARNEDISDYDDTGFVPYG